MTCCQAGWQECWLSGRVRGQPWPRGLQAAASSGSLGSLFSAVGQVCSCFCVSANDSWQKKWTVFKTQHPKMLSDFLFSYERHDNHSEVKNSLLCFPYKFQVEAIPSHHKIWIYFPSCTEYFTATFKRIQIKGYIRTETLCIK